MDMRAALSAGLAVAAIGLASAAEPPAAPVVASGYLPRGGAPSSLALVPPPPAAGSPAHARDEAAAGAAQSLKGSPRWALAALDAELRSPAAVQAFSCAADVDISPASTPRLYSLMRRTLLDVGLSTYPTKTKYQRVRPFVATSTATCSPDDEAMLRKDGSYPSGHAAIGWGWGLILAEAVPERAEAVLARGRAFGQSRVVCNLHWQSDVEESRVVAAATVAKLHTLPEFRADLDAVRMEVAAARAAGKRPTRDCAAEAETLDEDLR